jgi:hypothetical protein
MLLSNWKSKAKNDFLKKDYETEIRTMWPLVSEEDWNCFKQHCETPQVKEKEKWGKEMRAWNVGTIPSKAVVTLGRSPSGTSRTRSLLRRAHQTPS